MRGFPPCRGRPLRKRYIKMKAIEMNEINAIKQQLAEMERESLQAIWSVVGGSFEEFMGVVERYARLRLDLESRLEGLSKK